METTDRFVFENRGLADWLLQLVNKDPASRKAAAAVITDRFYMPLDLIPDAEGGVEAMEKFLAEFPVAVRVAVASPGFPAASFVRSLLELDLALQESWCEKVSDDTRREQESDSRYLAELGDNPSDAMRRRYARRVWIQCLRDCKRIAEEEPHEVFTTGSALSRVIDSLGAELLPASEILRDMLFSKHKADMAAGAIARMGRSGLTFYDDLLRGLKLDGPHHHCARALGAVLREAPEKIPEALRLARTASGIEQIAAIMALGHCGKRGTELRPEIEAGLLNILETEPAQNLWYPTVAALGQCARTSRTVDALLTRMDSADAGRRGEIILALGGIGIDAERVVPRLAEMLDQFEEYDPDWSYHGEHERVARALQGFGRSAAPAVPALIRHVWTRPRQYWTPEGKLTERPEPDEAVIQLLGALGGAAKEALPALMKLRDEMRLRDGSPGESGTPGQPNPREVELFWNVAIRKIDEG